MSFIRLLMRNGALLLIVVGASVLSFAYLFVFFAAITNFDVPPQDAPPAIAQEYARREAQVRREMVQLRHRQEIWNRGGVFLLGCGLALGVTQSVVALTRRRTVRDRNL